MGLRAFLTVVGLVLALIAGPRHAHADPQQDLELAETRFDNGRYEEAADILGPMLAEPVDPQRPDAEQRRAVYRQARPLHAASLIALGRESEADAVILEQFRADPFYEVPPGRFPQPVVDRFIRVAGDNRAQIQAWRQKIIDEQQDEAAEKAELERRRAERLAQLEAMAAEEKTVIHRSRWLAAVPFGIGQFQNGDVGLGVFFAASEVLTIASGVASFIVADNIPDCSTVPPTEVDGQVVDCGPLETRFQAARAVNWISLGTAAGLMIGGIIEAQVNFEGTEVEIRKRDLPPPVEITPDASVSEQGAIFGLRGRF